MRARRVVLAAALLSGGCAGHCGALGGLPPDRPPLVRASDGTQQYLVDRGSYKAFYDIGGRIQRVEYDSNGDGRPDQIALHDGRKNPREIDVDSDFDGKPDRWEEYDDDGRLLRTGTSRHNRSQPDEWTSRDAEGRLARKDEDDDGNGVAERSEFFAPDGRLVRVEVDSDGNRRPDRWQVWHDGRLTVEELDTDGDGRPDRRLRFAADGRMVDLKPIASAPPAAEGMPRGR